MVQFTAYFHLIRVQIHFGAAVSTRSPYAIDRRHYIQLRDKSSCVVIFG